MVQTRISGRTADDIAASIERGVRTGRFHPGAPLPTVRELAASLRVSPATVAAAYRRLRVRGLVAGRGRRGTRVLPRPVAGPPAAAPIAPAGTLDLATGSPDPDLLPPLEVALRTISPRHRSYGDAGTLPGLLSFAAGEFDADGIPSRSMTLASGALDALERILREHLRPGDRVAVEDPCFPGIADLASASGFVTVPYAIDDEGPLPDVVEQVAGQCQAIIVTPRAQNPFGSALSTRRAAALQDLIRKWPALLLIENDYAAPVAGTPMMTLWDRSRAHWAVIRSVSKFLGPDLRVAMIAGDALTIGRVQQRHAVGMRWVSGILQQLVLALWSDPASGRLLARAAEIYRQRRTALLAALAARRVEAHGRSGLHVWIPVRDEAHLVHALADRGWAVAAGERFRLATPPGIRVTISTLAPGEAERFADSLVTALRSGGAPFA